MTSFHRLFQMSTQLKPVGQSFAQALMALQRGGRDGLRREVVGFSVMTSLGALCFWLLVFLLGRSTVWSLAMTATHWAMPWLPSIPTSIAQASLWVWASQALSGLVAFLICVGTLAVLVILTSQVVLELFLMPKIRSICLPQYPFLSPGAPGSLKADLLSMMKGWSLLAAGILLWVLPIIGGLAFFALAAYTTVRSLVNDALSEVATPAERALIVSRNHWGLFFLGVMTSFFAMIPLAGLVFPSVLGASVCHFCLGALTHLREGPSAGMVSPRLR